MATEHAGDAGFRFVTSIKIIAGLAARNLGRLNLTASSSSFDSDDLLTRNKLAQQVELLKARLMSMLPSATASRAHLSNERSHVGVQTIRMTWFPRF